MERDEIDEMWGEYDIGGGEEMWGGDEICGEGKKFWEGTIWTR